MSSRLGVGVTSVDFGIIEHDNGTAHARLLGGTLRSDQSGSLDACCPAADQAAWLHRLLPPAG